jgi:hypothetical protein
VHVYLNEIIRSIDDCGQIDQDAEEDGNDNCCDLNDKRKDCCDDSEQDET